MHSPSSEAGVQYKDVLSKRGAARDCPNHRSHSPRRCGPQHRAAQWRM